MIELKNEQKLQVIAQMKETFNRNESYCGNVSNESLHVYYNDWARMKENLYKMMSSSPFWEEESLSIVVPTKTIRALDLDSVVQDLYYARDKYRVSYDCEAHNSAREFFITWLWEGLFKIIQYENSPFITQKLMDEILNGGNKYVVEYLDENSGKNFDIGDFVDSSNCYYTNDKAYLIYKFFRCNIGMKKSKLVTKLFRDLKIENMTFTREYSYSGDGVEHIGSQERNYLIQICDLLNPLEVENITHFSIHPVDFLTMSDGLGWTSCHSIEDNGCYHVGDIQLMGNDSAVIVYELASERNKKPYCFESKKIRSLHFIYAELTTIIQNMVYRGTSTNKLKVWREFLQKTITDYLHVDNRWKLFNSDWYGGLSKHISIRNPYEYLGYVDLRDDEKEKTVSCLLNNDGELVYDGWMISLGQVAVTAIDNSMEIIESSNDNLLSNELERVTCCDCGRTINMDSATYVPENEDYVCQDCLDENYYYCDDCNEYHSDSIEVQMTSTWTKSICSGCLERGISRGDINYCDDCDSYFDENLITYILTEDGDTRALCKDCISSYYIAECSECEALAVLDKDGKCYNCQCDDEEEEKNSTTINTKLKAEDYLGEISSDLISDDELQDFLAECERSTVGDVKINYSMFYEFLLKKLCTPNTMSTPKNGETDE